MHELPQRAEAGGRAVLPRRFEDLPDPAKCPQRASLPWPFARIVRTRPSSAHQTLCELDPQHTDLHLTLANLLVKAKRYQGRHRSHLEHALTLERGQLDARTTTPSAAYEEAPVWSAEAIEHLHQMIQPRA